MALVIYSTATGRVRRIISNSAGESQTNAELSVNHLAFAGETSLSARNNLSIDQYQAAVTADSGKTPANDRYAVIDNKGDVVNAIIADPLAGDFVFRHDLVAHDTATMGWRRMRDGTFQRPLDDIDHDIQIQQNKRTAKVSIRRRTQAEADTLTAQNLIEADAALVILNAEFDARTAVR